MTSKSTFSSLTLLQSNCPARAGQLASKKFLFGKSNRYAVAAVHTRFDAFEWFVWDAEKPDDCELPSVIRQADTLTEALGRWYPFEVGTELELLMMEEARG